MAALQQHSNNKYKIIIIGAGMAGLSAANHLVKNGVTNFKILEARNRIGGRIVATDTGSHQIELGANWIHGVLGNPMYELAMANGLIDIVHVPKPHTIVAAMEDGKQIPFPVLQEIYEAYICFLRRCEEYFLCHYLPPAGIQSVGEHIGLEATLYLDRIVNSDDRHLRQLIFNCLLKRETCITGCHSMEEIDLLELGSYTELQGGNIVLPSGYSSILEPVSRHIPPENICFLHPVSTIRWRYADEQMIANIVSPVDDSGIDVLANGDTGNESDDSDRTVTEFPVMVLPGLDNTEREVLCTDTVDGKKSALVQCNEMSSKTSTNLERTKKKYYDASEMSLDESDTTTSSPENCNKMDTSNVEIVCENGLKFYAEHVICTIPLGVLKENASTLFSPPLPQYKLDSIEKLLFGTVDKILLEYDRPFLNPNISEVMLLWDSDDDTCSSVSKEKMGDTWFRKIYSFSKITETLLLGWISGKEAEYMETLPHEKVAETCTEILRKFLNDPFVPKPKLCMCTSWHSQTYTRGSYSAMAVGASQIDIEHLAQPLYANARQNKPPLLFAGEHTHSSFYSTVHGAYLTGRSAAQTLLRPDSPQEIILDCEGTSDLSSWIQGIALED